MCIYLYTQALALQKRFAHQLCRQSVRISADRLKTDSIKCMENKLTFGPFKPNGPGSPGGPTSPCREDTKSFKRLINM